MHALTGMGKSEAIIAVLVAAIALVLMALGLQYFNINGWQNLAGMAGVLFFAFFAIVIGIVTKSLSPSIIGSAAVTALLMAFVYPLFAAAMAVIFVISLGLKILDMYSSGGSGYGY